MIKRTVVAVSLAAFALANAASGQENATFTLKSGERLTGQLMDMGGVGFTMRITGQEQLIPVNDVAVIDFTGAGNTQADWDRLSGGQFVVLKDGQILTGQLTDVGGSSPLRLTFRMGGSDRDLSSNDVARIVLARPNDTARSPTSGTAATSPQGLTVSSQQQWTPTGLIVRRGESITVNASGEIKFGAGANMTTGPNGGSETNADNPMPGVPTGTLIARIGNSAPFLIGTQTQFQAPAAGQLFLGVNDSHLPDNQGAFQVQIQRGGRVRR